MPRSGCSALHGVNPKNFFFQKKRKNNLNHYRRTVKPANHNVDTSATDGYFGMKNVTYVRKMIQTALNSKSFYTSLS